MEPLVSVCIPAYNNAGYIKETIDSILNQTYQNIELIVVDDNSKDNTYEVISSIPDKRVKAYRNEKNLGMSGNWNRCLELVSGEFVKLICADDLIEKDAIEKETRALIENPTAVLAESDSKLVDMQGKQHGTYKRYHKSGLVNGKKVARSGLRSQNYFGAPLANMIRKSALDKVGGFDTDFVYILDYDFYMRIASLGDIFVIHEPLNGFRIRNDSNTGQVMGGGKEKAYIAEHRMLLEKHKEELGLSGFAVWQSMMARRLRSFLISIYLKIFAK